MFSAYGKPRGVACEAWLRTSVLRRYKGNLWHPKEARKVSSTISLKLRMSENKIGGKRKKKAEIGAFNLS